MSLIQDALKRKSEESPIIPPPVEPVETPEPPADRKMPQPLLIISIVVVIAGLIAFLSGAGIYLLKPRQRVVQPIIKKSVSVTPAPALVPAPAAPPVAVPAPVAAPEAPVQLVETAKVETVSEPVKKEEPAPVIPIEWPELNLTGIAQSDNQSIAVINGKMLSAGRKLGEVIVREVNQAGVVVEFRGERRVMYINE